MSISQDRMISLIDEFDQLKQQYNQLREALNHCRVQNNPLRTYTELTELLARYPQFVSENLAKEKEHFRLRAKANSRDADRSRRKRQANGVMPRKQFTTIREKLDAKGIAPQFTPAAWKDIQPLTYDEAVAQDYSPEDLYAMFPDRAPKPPSTEVPDDMFRA